MKNILYIAFIVSFCLQATEEDNKKFLLDTSSDPFVGAAFPIPVHHQSPPPFLEPPYAASIATLYTAANEARGKTICCDTLTETKSKKTRPLYLSTLAMHYLFEGKTKQCRKAQEAFEKQFGEIERIRTQEVKMKRKRPLTNEGQTEGAPARKLMRIDSLDPDSLIEQMRENVSPLPVSINYQTEDGKTFSLCVNPSTLSKRETLLDIAKELYRNKAKPHQCLEHNCFIKKRGEECGPFISFQSCQSHTTSYGHGRNAGKERRKGAPKRDRFKKIFKCPFCSETCSRHTSFSTLSALIEHIFDNKKRSDSKAFKGHTEEIAALCAQEDEEAGEART